jgi:hypothetical protein
VAAKNGSKREATWEATRALREMHPDDWRALLAKEYRARGIPVPPTAEDKARKQLAKLAEEYPDIVAEVARGVALTEHVDGPRQDTEAPGKPADHTGKAAAKR